MKVKVNRLYMLARCPYDGYVWNVRLISITPKMCPSCKKRFKNSEGITPSYATKQLEMQQLDFEHYIDLRKWLDKANSISAECKDFEELIGKMGTK